MPRGHGNSARRDLRVSDADREQVAERLRMAAGEGRLTLEEGEERLGRAYGAKTFADLDSLTADLPAPGAPTATPVEVIPPGGRSVAAGFQLTYRRSLPYIALRWTVVFLVCAAGFTLSGAHGAFWPVYIALFGALRVGMVALRRREQRRRAALMAEQMSQLRGQAGFGIPGLGALFGPGGPFGPRGPFGRGGPFGPDGG
ncbi:MAG: DUF1707 domain-containing protein [Actinomycetota bacterium]|nr:DUF1707 domain-containing protein [Actinomycetota bacterium]